MSIIQQLKDNEKPFGLMSEEMQAKAKRINDVGVFLIWIDGKWRERRNEQFQGDYAYHLRADYEDECPECHGRGYTFNAFHMVPKYPCSRGCKEKGGEPEIVEGETCPRDQCPDMQGYSRRNGEWLALQLAIRYSDFIGFKFEDGGWYDAPIKPVGPDGKLWSGNITVDDIVSGRVTVLHATHVLFMQKKKE